MTTHHTSGAADLPEALRVPLDSLHADAGYLCGRLLNGSLTQEQVVESIRRRIDAAKLAALTAQAISVEPAGACTAELRRLHAELETLPVGYINRGIAPHTKGKTVFHEKPTTNLEERWWSRDEPVFLASQGQAPALDRDRIREIFMAHGFTVKEGQTDLKQYVYDAAEALLRAARAPADSVLEDAARYRWLRRWKGQEHEPPFTVQHEIDGALWGGDLDAAIDADRKQGATP